MATKVGVDKLQAAMLAHYDRSVLTRSEIKSYAKILGWQVPHAMWATKGEKRGTFVIADFGSQPSRPKESPRVEQQEQQVQTESVGGIKAIRNTDESYLSIKDDQYVRWGSYRDITTIVKSRKFFPTFVVGMSGNGKTTTIEQACVAANREAIRINFTRETNEDDLLGGMRLIGGDTVFQYGPVAEAYMRGAVLILDEIDVADPNKVMVLQAALENKPIFIKKLGKKIYPAAGYTVFATANTKGKGSTDGRFIGTNSLNEAFLDRFNITIEQNYPTMAIEIKILTGYSRVYSDNENLSERDIEVIKNLVQWGQITRESFDNGSSDELISTRRLVSAIQTYFVFGDISKAIKYSVARFDDEVKESFTDLYKQIDSGMRSYDDEA